MTERALELLNLEDESYKILIILIYLKNKTKKD